MGPGSLALVHFPETDRRRRQSRFSWSENRAVITDVIHGIDPALEIQFAPLADRVDGVGQTMVVIQRNA
jgi:hypothetical protein